MQFSDRLLVLPERTDCHKLKDMSLSKGLATCHCLKQMALSTENLCHIAKCAKQNLEKKNLNVDICQNSISICQKCCQFNYAKECLAAQF